MTLSAYFMSKSVFDVQGCRALTLALARLSCFIWPAMHVPVIITGGTIPKTSLSPVVKVKKPTKSHN